MKISSKRILVQLAFFILFNAAFLRMPLIALFVPVLECFSMPTKTVLCNFGVLQRNLSFTWEVTPAIPLASIAMFIIIGAFFGRAMCGWACPLGFFQDLWGHVARFFKKGQKELPPKIHFILGNVKYLVLFVTVALVASVGATYIISRLLGRRYSFSLGICGQAPYCLICPVPFLFVTLPQLSDALFFGASPPPLSITFYIGFSSFLFLLVSAFVVKRSWCRYVCPLGAMMGLFNKVSLLQVKKKPNACTTFCRGHQRECNKNCPMGVQVQRTQDPSSTADCIMCHECAEVCKNKAVEYKLG